MISNIQDIICPICAIIIICCIIKCPQANACHAVGNCDGSEVCAIFECIIANACTGYPSIVNGMVTLVTDVKQSIMDTSPSEIVYERSP